MEKLTSCKRLTFTRQGSRLHPLSRVRGPGEDPPRVQGYLAHKKQPPPQDHHGTLRIVLL